MSNAPPIFVISVGESCLPFPRGLERKLHVGNPQSIRKSGSIHQNLLPCPRPIFSRFCSFPGFHDVSGRRMSHANYVGSLTNENTPVPQEQS